jgi:hypothetical protein
MFVEKGAREWPFGRGFSKHRKALGSKDSPPLGRRLVHWKGWTSRGFAGAAEEQNAAYRQGAGRSKERSAIDLRSLCHAFKDGDLNGASQLATLLVPAGMPVSRRDGPGSATGN